MSDNSGTDRVEVVQGPSPNEMRDPLVRHEFKKASVWIGMICAVALFVLLIQPLLIIFAGLVFAAMLDGGVRLLGRVLKIGRGWRLMIVVLSVVVFLAGTFYLTGVQVVEQVTQLQDTLIAQFNRVTAWLSSMGVMPGRSDLNSILQQALGSVGRLTSWVGTAAGALTSLFMIMVIGLFLAMDPRVYERGVQWMIPTDHRPEFAITLRRMGETMRRLLAGRLLGMAAEGVLTWIALAIGGVPMALLLGIITGVLAALLRDETFEQHFGARRIDLGDAERVADRRIGGRSAPLAKNPAAARKADDVVDGQEISLVSHLGDQGQFVLDAPAHLGRRTVRVTPAQAALGLLAQPGGRRFVGRHDFLRVFVTQFAQRKLALRGDLQRAFQQCRRVETRQAQACAQMPLAVGKQRVAGVEHRGLEAQRG